MIDYIVPRQSTKLYRSGLTMIDRKDDKALPGEEAQFFSRLEEAIVAASTHLFLTRYIKNDPRYAPTFERAEKVKRWAEQIPTMFPGHPLKLEALKYIYTLEGDEAEELVNVLEGNEENEYKLGFFQGRMSELYKNGEIIHADRIEEMEEMDQLINELIVKSNGMIGTKEEVFNMFARANYSGNLLTLGRTIEKILGKGAFRQIAEKFKIKGKKRSKLKRAKELLGF